MLEDAAGMVPGEARLNRGWVGCKHCQKRVARPEPESPDGR